MQRYGDVFVEDGSINSNRESAGLFEDCDPGRPCWRWRESRTLVFISCDWDFEAGQALAMLLPRQHPFFDPSTKGKCPASPLYPGARVGMKTAAEKRL